MLHTAPDCSTANGNTNSFAARYWVFTIPTNQMSKENLLQVLQDLCSNYCFQQEIGETTNYHHYQGYMALKKKNRLSWLRSKFGPFHFEVCRNKQASINYCSNPNKQRIGQPVFFNITPPYMGEDLIRQENFYPWQQFIFDLTNQTPDDRSIYWIFESRGGVGKSKFAKTLCFHNPNIRLTTATKSADILTCAESHYTTYIFDFPRSLGDFCPFNALEQLKNGYITDCKLKKVGRTLMFKPPHIIIFSNREPNLGKLSADRWKVFEIVDNDLVSIDVNNIWNTNPNPNPNPNSILPL